MLLFGRNKNKKSSAQSTQNKYQESTNQLDKSQISIIEKEEISNKKQTKNNSNNNNNKLNEDSIKFLNQF
jgi:hypothetical protein